MYKRILLIFVLLFVFCTGVTLAQTTSGSISGTVVDQQQAAVANATIKVTEEGKTYTLTATSDSEGRFVFPIVQPGTYTIIVEANGFKKQERKGVVLVSNDKLSLGNLSLEVGALSETVNVTSEATPIQADSGERSFAVQGEQIRNIGLRSRSFINLATLAPGVIVDGAGNGNTSESTDITVNGVRKNSNNVQIDGITSVDVGNNSRLSRIPLDSVGEFKLLTGTYQAEYGRSSGAQIMAVTRSGSQDFHGSFYYYRRHTGLNANTFNNNRFNSSTNNPRPRTDQDETGYSIGGPIYIPGFFNKDKKKLFFFVNQEWSPRVNPNGQQRLRVPTALERAGDFSQSRNNNGALFPYIRDWTLGLPCNSGNTTGCFADGGVLGKIPANRLYALGQKILNLYPLPNYTPVGNENFNYIEQLSDEIKERNDTVRIDYNFNDNWRVYGRVLNNNEFQLRPYAGNGFSTGGNFSTFGFTNDTPRLSYAGTLNGALNATTAVEFTYGFSKNVIDTQMKTNAYTRTATGLTGLPLIYPNAVQFDTLSQFGYGGTNLTATPSYRVGNMPFYNSSRTDDFSGSLSKVWGNHVAKFGAFYQKSTKIQNNQVQFNGGIAFQDTGTGGANPFDTQFGYANAITGVYNNYQQASKGTRGDYRYTNLEWYAQDNWKVTSRLTLDYGMRFAWAPPTYDASGNASNFDPSQYKASAAPRLYFPVCIPPVTTCTAAGATANSRRAMDPALIAAGVIPTLANTFDNLYVGRIVPNSGNISNGLSLAGTNGIPKRLTKDQGILFGPRFGFAYDLTGQHNFILRGGFAIFYDRPQGNLIYDFNTNPPATITANLDFGLLQNLSSDLVNATVAPPNIRAIELNAKIPSTNSYNLGIQYKLPFDTVLDVAYVGSQGHHLARYRQINETPFGSAFLAANQDPTRAATATPGGAALPANFYRPYRGFGSIRMTEFNSDSNYNSLQITANRRFSKGLVMSANYTYSRAMGYDASTDEQGGNVRIDRKDYINYGRLGFDRTHNFNFNWVYEFPSVTKNKILGLATNGWQLSGIYRFQSGQPEQVQCNINGRSTLNITGSSSDNTPGCLIIGRLDEPTVNDDFHLWNVFALQAPPDGSIGLDTPRERMLVNAPPINNWDLSLSKKFYFWEKMRIEARLDAFNAFNHTQVAFSNFFTGSAFDTVTRLVRPSVVGDALTNRTGFGAANSYRDNRTMQWMLRFEF